MAGEPAYLIERDEKEAFTKALHAALLDNLPTILTALRAQDAVPVAWMYTAKSGDETFTQPNRANMNPRYWTETPQYTPNAAMVGEALARWKELPEDERNGERPYIMGFNAGWEAAATENDDHRFGWESAERGEPSPVWHAEVEHDQERLARQQRGWSDFHMPHPSPNPAPQVVAADTTYSFEDDPQELFESIATRPTATNGDKDAVIAELTRVAQRDAEELRQTRLKVVRQKEELDRHATREAALREALEQLSRECELADPLGYGWKDARAKALAALANRGEAGALTKERSE
jgi:hypothetical protein